MMMKSLEISGKTVEEAVQNALARLNVSREEIKVTVLKEGRHGILGLGTEEARIIVELKEASDLPDSMPEDLDRDTLETTTGVVAELLSLLGVTASVSVATESSPEEGMSPSFDFNLSGQDLGILIGRRGQTLSCLQYIVRLIMAHKARRLVPLTIDIEGYKKQRYESLSALALRLADQVRANGIPFTLEPMPPDERRIIHITLTDQPHVTTKSIGEGEARKVVILPE
ncbi:MAG: RNA-binding cell elongation regulator Jag/EloR [Chloroflexota bacterium]